MTNPRTHLYYSARYRLGATSARLGPFVTMRGAASVPVGPPLQCAAPPRYRFGTARALYYNGRCRLGTASVPLGPSITMRGADTPFDKGLIRSE